MYKARLNKLGVTLEFSNEAYNLLQTKKVTDENTGEHLYNAKIVCVEEGVLLAIKETKFERIADVRQLRNKEYSKQQRTTFNR